MASPKTIRTSSNHRLYTDTQKHLQLIADALQHGYRVSQLMKLDIDELKI